jgi:hypothetical protein
MKTNVENRQPPTPGRSCTGKQQRATIIIPAIILLAIILPAIITSGDPYSSSHRNADFPNANRSKVDVSKRWSIQITIPSHTIGSAEHPVRDGSEGV